MSPRKILPSAVLLLLLIGLPVAFLWPLFEKQPTTFVSLLAQGKSSLHQRDFDSAISLFTNAFEYCPTDADGEWLRANSADVYYWRGTAYVGKQNFDKAIDDFTAAINRDPYVAVYLSRAAAYGQKGDFQRAIADYSEAIQISPGLAEAWYDRAKAYKSSGESQKAAADFEKAKELGFRSAEVDDNGSR